MSASDLAAKWRLEVSSPFITTEVRQAVRACAADLEKWVRDEENALLTPKEASLECGLAPATIRKKLANGVLPNEGGPHRPRVRRRVLKEALSKQVARKLEVVR